MRAIVLVFAVVSAWGVARATGAGIADVIVTHGGVELDRITWSVRPAVGIQFWNGGPEPLDRLDIVADGRTCFGAAPAGVDADGTLLDAGSITFTIGDSRVATFIELDIDEPTDGSPVQATVPVAYVCGLTPGETTLRMQAGIFTAEIPVVAVPP